jgi:DNA modification methylase
MLNEVYHGNCLDVLKTFPDKSINCIITSPPYYQLRSYEGIPDYIWDGSSDCEHNFTEYKGSVKSGGSKGIAPEYNEERKFEANAAFCNKCGAWKGQLGLEPTYQLYLNHLSQIMLECKRVLRDDGTMWINLGDTYSTQSGVNTALANGDDRKYDSTYLVNRGESGKITKPKNYPNKSLMFVPHRFAIRCVDELGLICRNDIIWGKENGMPESITDRFSKKHEFFFFFVKQEKYYFDLDGVREKHKTMEAGHRAVVPLTNKIAQVQDVSTSNLRGAHIRGKNPGDVSDFWNINTMPSYAEHYATYNKKLIDKPIVAGSPEFVCCKCKKPREKIFETEYKGSSEKKGTWTDGKGQSGVPTDPTLSQFLGWTDCGCGAGFEGGIILDPFAGTGTTLIRGLELGRQVIGIEGKKEDADKSQLLINEYNSQLKLAI